MQEDELKVVNNSDLTEFENEVISLYKKDDRSRLYTVLANATQGQLASSFIALATIAGDNICTYFVNALLSKERTEKEIIESRERTAKAVIESRERLEIAYINSNSNKELQILQTFDSNIKEALKHFDLSDHEQFDNYIRIYEAFGKILEQAMAEQSKTRELEADRRKAELDAEIKKKELEIKEKELDKPRSLFEMIFGRKRR